MLRTVVMCVCVALGLSSPASAQTSSIVAETTIDAPADSVWWAWTTSEGLRAWLAPHADISLGVGGRMRTNYNPAGALDDPTTIENTILSFEPGRMLSIRVSEAPEGLPFPNAIYRMWTVIYFEPESAHRTRIRVVGLGFGPDEEDQRMRVFFDTGNRNTLEQLQRYFAGR